MSLAEFKDALQAKSALALLKPALDTLLSNTRRNYSDTKHELRKAASLFEKDARLFREMGSRQGITKLVVTPESLMSIFQKLDPNGLGTENGNSLIQRYIKFLADKGAKIADFELYRNSKTGAKANLTKFDSFQEYFDNASMNSPSKDAVIPHVFSNISAVRGLIFTHKNTANHIVEFINSVTNLNMAVTDFTELFERGHVYAQSTGRLMTVDDIEEDSTVLGRLTKLSVMLDEASSHLNAEHHVELLAAIRKDFKGTDLSMNIEFQLRWSDTGTGNQETGNISKALQLITNYRKLMTEGIRRPNGSFIEYPKVASDKEIVKILSAFHDKLETNFEKIQAVISQHVSHAADPDFLIELKSSTSLREFIEKNLVSIIISGKQVPRVKIQHPSTSINRQVLDTKQAAAKLKKVAQSIKTDTTKARKDLDKKRKNLSDISSTKVKPVAAVANNTKLSLTSLQNLLNRHLQDVISANMGDGNSRNVLNYRTGRLAASAKVEKLTQSKEGMITAFYSYMRNPYGTFSDGGRQQRPKSRDPKLLISKSIKEIALEAAVTRMRAVLV